MHDKESNDYAFLSEAERDYTRQRKLRAAIRQKQKRQRRNRTIGVIILLIIFGGAAWQTPLKEMALSKLPWHRVQPAAEVAVETTVETESVVETETPTEAETEPPVADTAPVLQAAERLAVMYDYDGAVDLLLQADPESKQYASEIAQYRAAKEACVAINVEEVPHVFFHSLINDDRGFRAEVCGTFQAKDNACWMCTTDEFRTILQQMYDAGYVMVSIHDLVRQMEDEDGNLVYTANTDLRLPAGKKAFVLSEDDLSYYHMYDNQGIATKLVLDENGKVKCEYTDERGETSVGDYDVVPILDTFVEEHPDFSYHGRRAMIALTGYNGVFGYRTDTVYETLDEERLDQDQREWLNAHPDFNYEEHLNEAKKIAEVLKSSGYEFASHTWGHRHADTSSLSSLQRDNSRWVESVQNIVGKVDTIIFAHGSDIGDEGDYSSGNEKYNYYKEAGYSFFCNVDGSRATSLVINKYNVRQGRIDLDGYYLWKVMSGNERACSIFDYLGIHDVSSFFDDSRITPVEVLDYGS